MPPCLTKEAPIVKGIVGRGEFRCGVDFELCVRGEPLGTSLKSCVGYKCSRPYLRFLKLGEESVSDMK